MDEWVCGFSYGWMDEWDKLSYGWIYGWVGGWIGQTEDRRINEWEDRWIQEWMGWTVGFRDGEVGG